MKTTLDAPIDTLDEHEQSFVAMIRKHGWVQTSLSAEGGHANFAYTTGFWATTGFPEIIVFSLDPKIVHDIFWDLFRDVQAGRLPPVSTRTSSVFEKSDAILLPCSKGRYSEYLGWNRWFYGGDGFDCLQLVWPDASGRFPWQPDVEEKFRNAQPDLTENGWL